MRTADERDLIALEEMAAARLAAVGTPDDVAMGRVRDRVSERASRSGVHAVVPFPGRYGRVLALAAAAVIIAAIIVGVGAVRPRSFATAAARLTLFPDEGVVHFTISVTSSWATGTGGTPATGQVRDASIVNEYWLAQGGRIARNVERDSTGQTLREVISRGDVGRVRQAVAADPMADGALATSSALKGKRFAWLTETPIRFDGRPMLSDLDWWLQLRANLATGTVEVVGQQDIGGQRCWHVRSVDATFTPAWAQEWGSGNYSLDSTAPFPAYRRTIDAYLRAGDYAPVQATVRMDVDFGPADQAERGAARIQTLVNTYAISGWDVVPTSTLAPEFFGLDALPVSEAAVTHITYGARDIGTFTGFPVWGLRGNGGVASRQHLTLGAPYDFEYSRGDLVAGLADPNLASWASNAITPVTYSLENAIPDGPPVADERVTSYYTSDNDVVHAWVVVTSMPAVGAQAARDYLRNFSDKGTAVGGTFEGMPYSGYVKVGPATGDGATRIPRFGRIVAVGPTGVVMVAFGADGGQFTGIDEVLASLAVMNPSAK